MMDHFRFVYEDKEYVLSVNDGGELINDEAYPIRGLEIGDVFELLDRHENVDFDTAYYDQPCPRCLAGKEEKAKYFKFMEYDFYVFTKKGEYIISNISKEYENTSFNKLLKKGTVDNSYIVSVTVCPGCNDYSVQIEQCDV